MYFPVFACVLDVAAIGDRLPYLSDADRQQTQYAIITLLKGNARSDIDNSAAQYLLQNFGPKSKTPCVLTPLLAEGQNVPRPAEEDGKKTAYYGFARVERGQIPTLEDVDYAVTFECVGKHRKSDDQQMIYPKSAMAGPNSSFIAFMYMTCCATDANRPLSALTGFRKGDKFIVNWQASPRSRETGMHQLFFDESGVLDVQTASGNYTQRSMLHRLMHAGGYEHGSCGNHARLRYEPRMG